MTVTSSDDLSQPYTLIDLFAGAGGMTLGFTAVGFDPVFAVESDPWAARTYKTNFGAHVLDAPIETVDSFPRADVIIGGPPCQGFSPLGRDRDHRSRAKLNTLWKHYARTVEDVRPLIFVVENVPEFLKSDQFDAFRRHCAKALPEYELDHAILNAADYGVPQRRKRGIILGSRIGLPAWPKKTHGDEADPQLPYRTVREAIADLPRKPTDKDLHFKRNPRPESLERYRAVPEGGNRFDLARNRSDLLPDCWRNKPSGTTDVFGRLWWDRPSFTIRTEFFKPEKGRYLHPKEHRPITHREAARLQTFPDDFTFEGSRTQIAKQIGNAVPPRLAEAIARSIREHLVHATRNDHAAIRSTAPGVEEEKPKLR